MSKEKARVGVRLSRRPRMEARGEPFQPMGLPNELRVDRGEVLWRALEQVRVEFEVGLEGGRLSLPVSSGEPCVVDVPPECVLRGEVIASRGRDGSGSAVVTDLILDIDPPIVFKNIFETLLEVHRTFEDRSLRSVVEVLDEALAGGLLERNGEVRRMVRAHLSSLGEELRDGVDRLADVRLSRVRGTPTRVNGSPCLALSFSGVVAFLGAVPVPFFRVRLPAFILPLLHASLDPLLSGTPLATASVRGEAVPVRPLLETLLDAFAQGNIALHGRGQMPDTHVVLETILQSELQAELTFPEELELEVRVSAERSGDRIAVKSETLRLLLDGAEAQLELEGEIHPRRLLDALFPGTSDMAPDREALGRLCLRIPEGTSLGRLRANVSVGHPLVQGRSGLDLALDRIACSGAAQLSVDPRLRLAAQHVQLVFGMGVEIPGAGREFGQDAPGMRLKNGRFGGRLTVGPSEPPLIRVDGEGDLAWRHAAPVGTIPELDIAEGALVTELEARLTLKGRARITRKPGGLQAIDIRDSRAHVQVGRLRLELGPRSLEFPTGSTVACKVEHGELATSGLGELAMDVTYDLKGESPVLRGERREVPIFVEELRRGEMTVKLNPAGALSIEGPDRGLYDARFFNALVNPASEIDRLMEILASDEAIRHVIDAVAVFSEEAAGWLELAHREVKRVRQLLEEEGVTEPRHVIPRANMARIFSRILCGSDRLADRLAPIIQKVTDGHGLDRMEIKRIVNELHPDHLYDFELDRILRWLDHVLSPWDPIPAPVPVEAPPLARDPLYQPLLEGVPSAAELYALVQAPDVSPESALLAARLAPYMSWDQVVYMADHAGPAWPAEARARLVYIREVKRRTRMISEQYGGIGHLPQALAIAFFLGELTTVDGGASSQDEAGGDGATPAAFCTWSQVLGPEDVAVLLQANLALPLDNTVVQVNQRLLLDYITRRPDSFLLEVLVEMGRSSPRVLAGVLMALLEVDQGKMRDPLDIPALFSARLGVPVPRRADYMAGGRHARESYFLAVYRVAESIIAHANPYLALKEHVQVVRHEPPAVPETSGSVETLVRRAQERIAAADRVGATCIFTPRRRGPHARARDLYRRAFRACAELLKVDPYAFHAPWFKSFWERNHEALVVLSVVRNYQEDVDNVRKWLHVRTGIDRFENEQALVDGVVDALYYFEEDRERIRKDPLIRLLIEPPPGRYDFTIVSCMGIITEGATGSELKETFERLEAQRGIKTIRADTPTMRSLEFNARRVEEAIRKTTTPWGYVGYSQGCANALKAESMLRGGTPEQQALLKGLRCRNLLFGAHNGSAHGTCSNFKLQRALEEGEYFLKHYQALFSAAAIDQALKGIRLILDSRFFVHVLGGAESVSHEVCVGLARDGQYLGHVPTSTVRGVVEEEYLPEALEFLSHVLTHQVSGERHDTQVTLPSSVGYPNLVVNEYTRLMEACDMGSTPQATHHWSPLLHETAFITTERDIERAIYDFPKDRHIMPWIEVNARFGIIERVDDSPPASGKGD